MSRLARRWRNPNDNPGEVFVVAHRGAFLDDGHIFCAENSVSAILRARELGCDMVEVDMHFTADGTAIVMHDATLERTSTGQGPIAEMRWDDLKDMDLVHPVTRAPLGEKIPSLEEIFQALGPEMMINVELKTGIEAIPEVARIAAMSGVSEQVTVKSNRPEAANFERVTEILTNISDPVDFIPVIIDRRDGLAGFEKILDALDPHCIECIVREPAGEIGYNLLERRGMTMDGGVLFSMAARQMAYAHNTRLFINTLYVNPMLSGELQWNGGRNCELGRIAPDSVYGFWIAHGATVIQTDQAKFVLDWLRQSGFRSC